MPIKIIKSASFKNGAPVPEKKQGKGWSLLIVMFKF
jgi:hypothetical protein